MKERVGEEPGINLTLDVKQRDAVAGGSSEMKPPLREVPHFTPSVHREDNTDNTTYPVYVTSDETPNTKAESILTRETDPRNQERVQRIVQ